MPSITASDLYKLPVIGSLNANVLRFDLAILAQPVASSLKYTMPWTCVVFGHSTPSSSHHSSHFQSFLYCSKSNPSSSSCPAEVVAPQLIGRLLVKRQPSGELLWGVLVETEAYSQEESACHGYRRRTPSNETLFGEPGRFYVYVSYGIHHCVKRALLSTTPSWA